MSDDSPYALVEFVGGLFDGDKHLVHKDATFVQFPLFQYRTEISVPIVDFKKVGMFGMVRTVAYRRKSESEFEHVP